VTDTKKHDGEITAQKKQPLTDEEIVELYFARNEDAIRATAEKYGKYLYTVALGIVHSHEDSEECVSDTYLSAWNSMPPERPEVLKLFLARITRNAAIDRFRAEEAQKRISRKRLIPLDELDERIEEACNEDGAEGYFAFTEFLTAFLASRTERSRAVFIYRYFYADDIDKIAKRLRIGKRTVFRELKSVKQDLKNCLSKEGWYL